MREEPRVVDVGGRRDRGQGDAVGRDHNVVLGPRLAPVRRIGAGQLAPMLGPYRAAVDDHVPGRGLGPCAHHLDQSGMDLAQQGWSAPGVQATAQGGAASTLGSGLQLAPLHALTNKKPERLDYLDGRNGRPSDPRRAVFEPIDDPRHQLHRPRPHARLPVPKASERTRDLSDAGKLTLGSGFWKRCLIPAVGSPDGRPALSSF